MIESIRNALSDLSISSIENVGLALDRYIKHLGSDTEAQDQRAELLRCVSSKPAPSLYNQAFNRWQQSIDRMDHVQKKKFKVQDRLIVGLGSESVLETAVTLHKIYGVPFIPGSALKGLARHFFLTEIAGVNSEGGLQGDLQEIFYELFGDTSKSGCVVFLDAWYDPSSVNGRPIRMDVMTPHHMDYYKNKGASAPTDFDDPNPVRFVSAVGNYLVAVQGADDNWAAFAMELLERALNEWGVGGKTSSGYGRMIPADAQNAAGGAAGNAQAANDDLPQWVRQVQAFRQNEVSSQIGQFIERWRELSDEESKRKVANILKNKLEEAGLLGKQKWLEKDWVKKLLKYIEDSGGG